MILDRFERWTQYSQLPAWREAFEALAAITPELPDGDHPVRGSDIVLKIGTGPTFDVTTRQFEAHREFIDVQMMLSGAEIMLWTPLEGLEATTPYNPATDVGFFDPAPPEAPLMLEMRPGLFVVFFPEDAHMPGLNISEQSQVVRKAVIKLRAALLR